MKLPNGLTAVGTGGTKKVSKHNAARAMLDILEGRAAAKLEVKPKSLVPANQNHPLEVKEDPKAKQGILLLPMEGSQVGSLTRFFSCFFCKKSLISL